MAKRKKKRKGVICPYCQRTAALVDSIVIYRTRSYGPAWRCAPCDAYVGCHPGTERPLGRLANAELRKAKIEAHKYFDSIWREGHMSRSEAYRWLADQLGMHPRGVHIGYFGVEQCVRVVEISRKFYLERNATDAKPNV